MFKLRFWRSDEARPGTEERLLDRHERIPLGPALLGPSSRSDSPPIAMLDDTTRDGEWLRVNVGYDTDHLFAFHGVDFRVFGEHHPGWLTRHRWTWACDPKREGGRTAILLPSGVPEQGTSTRAVLHKGQPTNANLACMVGAQFMVLECRVLCEGERGNSTPRSLLIRPPCVVISRSGAVEAWPADATRGTSFPVHESVWLNLRRPIGQTWLRWVGRHTAEGLLDRCFLPSVGRLLGAEDASAELTRVLRVATRTPGKVMKENEWVLVPVLYEILGPRLAIGVDYGDTVRLFSTRRKVQEWHTALTSRAPENDPWPFESRHGLVRFPPLGYQTTKNANTIKPDVPEGVHKDHRKAWKRAMFLYACAAGEMHPWMPQEGDDLAEALQTDPSFLHSTAGEHLLDIFRPRIEATDDDQKRLALLDAIRYFTMAR